MAIFVGIFWKWNPNISVQKDSCSFLVFQFRKKFLPPPFAIYNSSLAQYNSTDLFKLIFRKQIVVYSLYSACRGKLLILIFRLLYCLQFFNFSATPKRSDDQTKDWNFGDWLKFLTSYSKPFVFYSNFWLSTKITKTISDPALQQNHTCWYSYCFWCGKSYNWNNCDFNCTQNLWIIQTI